MAIIKWLCTNSTKSMVVKIVHPGGHVELYDRQVLAAEVLVRNPRCCVAHPHVFKQPWAIVSPQTTLMPGQKFYVVPINTIRKLQNLSFRHSPNLIKEIQASQSCDDEGEDGHDFPCLCTNYKRKKAKGRNGYYSNRSCLGCLVKVTKSKRMGENPSEETRSSSSSSGFSGSNTANRKGVSPKMLSSSDNWQPNLESIVEELSN